MALQYRARQPGSALAQKEPARNLSFQHIPAEFRPRRPSPYRLPLADILGQDAVAAMEKIGRMTLHCIGDTGGVKRPVPQHLVAQAMENSATHPSTTPVSFCYHLGDVVYYNGEVQDYWDQFYEPYEHYPLKIFGIPGNHDGELLTPHSTSLKGFYETFVAAGPHTLTHESRDSGREAMFQPYFYWTLETPFATVIGLYTNVPEHGRIDAEQRAWFVGEMTNADPAKSVIVALHHPVYSFDNHHSGSATMAWELQNAINASRRVPNMVLSAHVHNYQRMEISIGGHKVPFFVIGGSGYWNLHHLAAAPGYQDPDTECKLIAAIDNRHGFMTFELSKKIINGNYTTVPRPQENWNDPDAYNMAFDVFSYSALPIFLPEGVDATLLPATGTHIPPHPHDGHPHDGHTKPAHPDAHPHGRPKKPRRR